MPSVSPAQHRLMEGVAHNPKFASKVGIPQSVGKDFAAADAGKKFDQGGQANATGDTPYRANDGMADDQWLWGPNMHLGGEVNMAEGGRVGPSPEDVAPVNVHMLQAGGRTYKAPTKTKIPGHGVVDITPLAPLEDASNSYRRFMGKEAPTEYPMFDEDRARRIAEAYDAMKHDPNDPKVKRAYDAMIEETLGQFKVIKDKGYEFTFNKGNEDPYAASPALGYLDMRDRGHLSVFPTDSGFGTLGELDTSSNPLLKRVGPIGDHPNATANDAFRIVHDAFGHFGPGNPFFRHKGEERAWLNHAGMYSDEALPAMTSETRGQNSWLNFGPYGEKNRTASTPDTVFADQKSGLMDPFTWEETGYAGGGKVSPRLVRGSRNMEFVPNLDELFGDTSRDAGALVRAHTEKTGKEGASFGNEFFHTPLIRGERTSVNFDDNKLTPFSSFATQMHAQQMPYFSVHSHPVISAGGAPQSIRQSTALMDQHLLGGPLWPSGNDLNVARAYPHTMMIESAGLPNNRLAMTPMDHSVDPAPSAQLAGNMRADYFSPDFGKRLADYNRGAGLWQGDMLPLDLLISQGMAERGVPMLMDKRAQSGLAGRGDTVLASDLLPDFKSYLSRHNEEPF